MGHRDPAALGGPLTPSEAINPLAFSLEEHSGPRCDRRVPFSAAAVDAKGDRVTQTLIHAYRTVS
ncbi:hypothetical protein ACF1HJ_33470 [Streptomyces sp. NPDC013978]|uniref:hypothetical protein n=1 Tax=Streptomyces sp. NPDC013978 TaxID=3364869 RepID=UPI003702F0CB